MAARGTPGIPDVVCIGSAALDVLLTVEALPGPDGRVPAQAGMMAGGGPAATAAVTLARLGARVELVARVGDDLGGRIIREQLGDEGVGIRWLLAAGALGRSALSSGIIRHGPPSTRSLVALAAGPPLSVDDLPADARAACERTAWLHADHAGWQVLAALRRSGTEGAASLDGGNPVEDLDLGLVDLYVPSVGELMRWTGAPDEPAAMERAVHDGARAVITTRGELGAAYMGPIDPDDAWPTSLSPSPGRSAACWHLDVPAYPTQVRSTLGAGDVYHGGLLAALVAGSSVRTAMTEAAVAAGLSCLGLDGRSAIPDRRALDAAVDTWSLVPSPAWRSDA